MSGRSVQAQVVHLPTFRFFSSSGSVSVPDSGGVYLGGNGSSLQGMTRTRVPGLGLGSRQSNSLQTAADAHVRVFIIDHAAWDRAVLGFDPATERPPANNFAAPNNTITANFAPRTAEQIQQQQADEQARLTRRHEQGKAFVRKGRQAAAIGDLRMVKFYYETAMDMLDDSLVERARQEMNAQFARFGIRPEQIGQ